MRKRKLYVSELIKRNINENVIINILTKDTTYIISHDSAIKEFGSEQVKTWQMITTLTNKILIIHI